MDPDVIEYYLGELDAAIVYARTEGIDALRGRNRLLDAATTLIRVWDEQKRDA